ncbi:MAG: cation:proton antiporter, partial [Wenzhouxiangella sp.]
MHEFNIGLLVVAGSALILGLLSKPLKRYGLPDSITLLLIGVAAGPIGLGLLVPEDWGDPMLILEQVARLALAVGLMGVALQLPKNYLYKQWRSLLFVLLLGMPFMWLSSSVMAGTIFGLSVGAALLVGAIVTPTDPVVAS